MRNIAVGALAFLCCLGCGSSGPNTPDGNIAASGEICDNGSDEDGDGLVDCSDADCFLIGVCYSACLDLCVDGASICDSNGLRTCAVSSNGCKSFAAASPCNGGLLCSGGTCVSSCRDQCTVGSKQCSNTGGVVKCQLVSTGCTDWVGPVACGPGEVCSGGACVGRASCSNQCTLGASRCTASGQVQTCSKLVSGCTEWSYPLACPSGEVCDPGAGHCAPEPKCTPGRTRCSQQSFSVETCDANANWQVTQSCLQACQNGTCTAGAACNPGGVRCNGSQVEICNTSGSAWLFNQSCAQGCAAGLCTGGCTAGAKRCNGRTPELCNAQGSGWTGQLTCSTDCYQGECIQTDLLVDGMTKVLEGDLRFQNSVIVRNGGQLKVGPSGVLKLRAKTIHVDGASNINANEVGDDTRCAGTATKAVSCYYYGTRSGTVMLPACYGAGSSASVGLYYCTGYATGPQYDNADDLSISEGSVYDSTKGGGLVKLIADSIQVDGQITANGGSGASGGGILLAADSLKGTGAIQTAGGGTSPTGGVGRVKILHGSLKDFTGSITGTQKVSVMPPLELVSGSHPEQERWYNDGLGDWFIAWSKPYPTANGYYYAVSTEEDTLPSQVAGKGTFTQSESLVVPATEMEGSVQYFHIVSVDSAFNVGTVKNTLKAQINRTPPSIISSSHPSPAQWYDNQALYVTWSNPQADQNFTGFYYVFDKFADTVPSASSATFTTQKQLLMANTPPGIWVFHLVNRDTRNALTREASHRVFYVGTEPAKENLSGSVFDASNSNAPLSGVEVEINRGLFSTLTVTNGTYTFNGKLYVGSWEVTAKKDGYLPQTKTIQLVAGSPLNENFTLTRKQ